MLRVYTASKLKHGAMWRALCAENSHFIAHARWLKHNSIGTPDDPADAVAFWLQDEQDVKDADVLVLYAEEGEKLRGALVEVGIALAWGVPVIVVGSHSDYGTWQFHPGVRRVDNMREMILELLRVEPAYVYAQRRPRQA